MKTAKNGSGYGHGDCHWRHETFQTDEVVSNPSDSAKQKPSRWLNKSIAERLTVIFVSSHSYVSAKTLNLMATPTSFGFDQFMLQ